MKNYYWRWNGKTAHARSLLPVERMSDLRMMAAGAFATDAMPPLPSDFTGLLERVGIDTLHAWTHAWATRKKNLEQQIFEEMR